jgi:hypothetical protein
MICDSEFSNRVETLFQMEKRMPEDLLKSER